MVTVRVTWLRLGVGRPSPEATAAFTVDARATPSKPRAERPRAGDVGCPHGDALPLNDDVLDLEYELELQMDGELQSEGEGDDAADDADESHPDSDADEVRAPPPAAVAIAISLQDCLRRVF